MNTEVTLNMLPDLFACAALIMLSIYHLMIFWGRKQDPEEKYNLYFALFVVVATLFIIAPYFQPQYFVYAIKPPWIDVINFEVLMMIGLFFSGIKFLNSLLKVEERYKRYFYFTYLTIPLNFFLSLTSNFIGKGFYYQNILPIILLNVTINLVLIFSVYGIWGYRQKLFKQNFFLVLYIGFLSLTLNILVYRAIELLSIPRILILNHYVSVIILFVFTYALSIKFNKEYIELKELKISLEGKVIQRTHDLKKANMLLEEKNTEVEKQKQEIIVINKQLEERATDLANLDEAKSRFFTNISHEFRTPLTLIIGPLEIMLPRTKDEKLTAEYSMMLRQAKRLLELINQLLEISKLQKGVMMLDVVEDNFTRFVRTLVSAYSSLALELTLQLIFSEDCDVNTFSFDKDKVEKIVSNLITNALKFTPRGGKVEVILNQRKNQPFVEIIVRDSGKGIAQDKIKYIFDPFYQIDPIIKHSFEGSGIGLALVKELVELHQGSIKVNSNVITGTEFIVQLPIEIQHHNFEVPSVSSEQIESQYEEGDNTTLEKRDLIEKPIILLVEDNDDMRHYIASNLSAEYNLIQAVNGKEGCEKALELIPDLIISDIMMPVMDGLELTKRIKQSEATSHIPVILLTAKASDESKLEGLGTLADDYITKPFSVVELNLRLRNLIVNRQRLKDKFKKSITINPSEIVTTSMDEVFLRKALQSVEQNMNKANFNAEQFCDEIGMSRAHVHRKLKALTDQSATRFIRSIRLKRAAQLLKQKTGTVSEIAYDTGFNNLSYFSRCFKEEFNILPSDYVSTEV